MQNRVRSDLDELVRLRISELHIAVSCEPVKCTDGGSLTGDSRARRLERGFAFGR